MQLKTKVIVTGVTNLHDARYCAGMGVDRIVLPIDPKLGTHVDAPTWKEITGWISGTELGAEISDGASLPLDAYGADFYVTSQSEIVDKYPNVPFVLRVESAMMAKNLLPKYKDKVQAFILDWENATLETVASQLKSYAKHYPIYVGFGITHENVEAVLVQIAPEGIALKGGKEIKVGMNDFDGLADVLEKIEVF